MKPWLILAVVLALLGSAGGGYIKGRADNEAKHVAILAAEREKTLEAVKAQSAAESRRLAAEREIKLLAQALEDQAYAEPVTNPTSLPASRVRRLNSR